MRPIAKPVTLVEKSFAGFFTAGPITLKRTTVAGSGRELAISDNGKYEHLDSLVEDCIFRGKRSWQNGLFLNRVSWAERYYDFSGIIRRILVHRIKKEHAGYFNPAGDCLFEDWNVHDIAGQIIQLYFRSWESSEPEKFWKAPKRITFRRIFARRYGMPYLLSERAGFGLTVGDIGPETDVVIENCDLKTRWRVPRYISGKWIGSHGAWVVQRARSLIVRDSVFDHKMPDRPVGQAERIEGNVLLENIHVPEGKIDLQEVEGTVKVRGCTGAALLRVRGQFRGMLGAANGTY